MATKADSCISTSLTGTRVNIDRYCDEAGNVQRIPSGPEANASTKRPDICMQLSFETELIHPCNTGRTIYVPGITNSVL